MPRFQINGTWYEAANYRAARDLAGGSGATSVTGGRSASVAPQVAQDWEGKTAIVMGRSTQLKALDTAVAKWVSDGAGTDNANISDVDTKLTAWKSAQVGEAGKLADAARQLKAAISQRLLKGKSQLTSVVSTGVRTIGWRHVQWDPLVYTWTTAVPTAEELNAELTTAEKMRVNEAVRRSKLASIYARDTMIKIAKGAATTKEGEIYANCFGAVDAARVAKIRKNFEVLALAFERGPDMIDLRNTEYGKTCYAACFRANLSAYSAKEKVLSLTGGVDMFLGRAFFGKGSYEKSSDTTVGTLVHEFAHGAISAVDVPPVSATGAWTHTRKSDDPTHADFGETTTNSIQASTPELGRLLAQHQPDYAAVNADSYGQFARLLLMEKGG